MNILTDIKDALDAADPYLRGKPVGTLETEAPAPIVDDYEVPPTYTPRELSGYEFRGQTDVSVVRTAYSAGFTVLLLGPPGTGKTALVMAALSDVHVVPGHSETEVSDFVGSWVQRKDGNYEWADGPLIKAMEAGEPLLVDEIPMIDPRVLAVLYSAMDGRDNLQVTANPARGEITAKPGFLVIGTGNPDAPGSIMSEALLSRFRMQIEVCTDWNLAASLGVPAKIILVARNLETRRANHEIMRAPQLRELLAFRDISMVFGEAIALRNFVNQSEVSDRDTWAELAGDAFGVKVSPLSFK